MLITLLSLSYVEPKESNKLVRLVGKKPFIKRSKSGLVSGEVKILKMLVARSEKFEERLMFSSIDNKFRKKLLV